METMHSVRVFLLDRYTATRMGLRQAFEREGLQVMGENPSAEEALSAIGADRPDSLVMDVELEDMSPLLVVKRARMLAPQMPILALSAHPDCDLLHELWCAGARGFVRKDEDPWLVFLGVLVLANGASYLSPAMSALWAENPQAPKTDGDGYITARELEVVRLVSGGRTNREVALALQVSESTVEYHLRQLYRRLGLHRRAALLQTAKDHGWL